MRTLPSLVALAPLAALADEPALEVVVTGTRTETPLGDAPVATDVIDREAIEASGAEDLASLLEEQPNVDVSRSFLGAAVRLQGLEPEKVLILVDGERQLGAKDGVIDLSRFPVENIERIEIVRGPASALYGSDAMGGVINVITRGATSPVSADLRLRYGTLATFDAAGGAGVARGRLDTRLTFGHHRTAGYDLKPDDVATTGSAIRSFEVGDHTKVTITPDLWVVATASWLHRELTGVDLSPTGAVYDRGNRIDDVRVSVRPRWLVDERSSLGLSASYAHYRDRYEADQRGSDAMDDATDTREDLGQASLQYDRSMGDAHLLTVGIDGLAHRMRTERLDGGVGHRERLSVYVQDQWDVIEDRLAVLPGARLDVDTWFGVHPTPKLALRVDPMDGLVLRASFGGGYRAPDFKELFIRFENPGAGYVVEGNPELRPEQSQSAQLGVEVAPGDRLWLSVNGFGHDVVDLIDIGTLEAPVPGQTVRYGYVNVASAHTVGAETAVRVEPVDAVAVQLGYTLAASRDETRKRPLEGRATHRGTARLTVDHAPWGVHGMARAGIVGPRPFFVDQDGDGVEERIQADPYVTLDLRVGVDLAGHGELFVGADNVFDAGNVDYHAIPPRVFYAGVRGRIEVLEGRRAAADPGGGLTPSPPNDSGGIP